MPTHRQIFFDHVGQTSPSPLAIEVARSEGVFVYDQSGKKYFDLISGIAVSNLGHGHPEVIRAIKDQLDNHAHVMVYGEFIQSPQAELAKAITDTLPSTLDNIFFVNSGSEAVEGALKLAKRYTGRPNMVSFSNAYHGSTHGALSVTGDESLKDKFRPLLPGVYHIPFNDLSALSIIDKNTACVIVEPVQGEAGVIPGTKEFHQKLREVCSANGTLLIHDEIQSGFGRTGTMWAHEQLGVVPDILLTAKGMGGGLPLGGFISSREIMSCLTLNPVLGHITTFGGHPVSCAASLATLRVIQENNLIDKVEEKAKRFIANLQHSQIKEIRSLGLLMAVQLESSEKVSKAIEIAVSKGIITDWFLFCDSALRIAPPLTISLEEIDQVCELLIETLDELE